MWLVRMCTMNWRSIYPISSLRALYAALSICNGGIINATRVNESQGRAFHRGKVGMREVSYIIQSSSTLSVYDRK